MEFFNMELDLDLSAGKLKDRIKEKRAERLKKKIKDLQAQEREILNKYFK